MPASRPRISETTNHRSNHTTADNFTASNNIQSATTNMDIRPQLEHTADDIVKLFNSVVVNFPRVPGRGTRPNAANQELVRTAIGTAYEKGGQSQMMAALQSQFDSIGIAFGMATTPKDWDMQWKNILMLAKRVEQEAIKIQIRQMEQNADSVADSVAGVIDNQEMLVMSPLIEAFRDAETHAMNSARDALASAESAAKLHDDFVSTMSLEEELTTEANKATANAAAAKLIAAEAQEARTVELAEIAAKWYEEKYQAIRQWAIDWAFRAAAGES